MEQSSLFANSISINTNLLSQNNYQESVRYISVTRCAVDTSIILHLAPSTPFLCVPYSIRALVYHSIFWKPTPHLTNAPHIWCEGLAQHVRRAYNITRIGKTVANVW